jgi:hypothetical protein
MREESNWNDTDRENQRTLRKNCPSATLSTNLLPLKYVICCLTCAALYCYVFILVPPDDSLMCKPEFTQKLHDLTISDGDQLQLTCTIKGDPEPQVNWTKNGQVCLWKCY